jgi:formylglycine-generating enzyme required for sulfatase activity
VVMQAIEQEITVKDRNTLAKALGRMGDPRIVTDLRAQGHPDGHPGYVNIPAGRYRYGENKQPFPISELFRLSRYPVTNSQYECFIEDGGYQNQKLWSEEGWGWREQEQVSEPEYWRHHDFAAPNQPVVGVSFWEAEAFTTWAGGVLPSERQWEAAARGPRGYEYTWGNTWEDVICNSEEAGLGSTSAVGIFPRSRSRDFGLEDMAGNVWEWCSTKEASGRVFRGGSWDFPSWFCRAAYRFGYEPNYRYFHLGFRVALVPPGKRAGSSKRKRTEPGAEAEGAKRRSPPPRAGVEGDGGEGKRAVRPKERN